MSRVGDFNKAMSNPSIQKQIKADSQRIADLESRVLSQHRLLTQILIVLKSYDAKISAIHELCQGANVFTWDQFESSVDEKIGLRKKLEGETLEIGDTVWVDFTATEVGNDKNKTTDENFVLRLGSNSVVFESSLVGKKVGETGIEHEAQLKEGGAKIKFVIDIKKAKAKVKSSVVSEVSDVSSDDSSDDSEDVREASE
jgi:hypothetical protein